ncbi:RNA-binding protein [Geotalea daltonii FRC-32]|uniref:RNA-binding protein n=1 Tax=Geotalea daltonii (strain DSM 22248 / JCM 15807 / FRC-32) TaxID=316067 RepID=B9M825_GEODF|nr:RNP-1 like RNA-binding protein [Geotalea daltonii]ACM20291.1 RNA-binding protein [Geotalea daltonii FRC-32]
MSKELYVGHISDNASEEDLRKLFSVMGTVTSVHLIVDPETNEFKHCGYVRMASGIDLKEVAETLDGALLVDRVITVSIARPQKPGMSKSGRSGKFGGPKKPGLGSKGSTAPRAGTGSKTRGEAKAGPGKKSAEGSKQIGSAKFTATPRSADSGRKDQRSGHGSKTAARPAGRRKP